MGLSSSKEQLITTAIENQDASELRTILKDLTSEQVRNICKSYVPSDENQCTILHYATWQDNPDILAPLLDYVDDLEIRDGLGWTPLMAAVNRGSKQNVTMLLTRGAKIDCDWTGGMSLIADAMNFNDLELITILIDHGARVIPTDEMLANGQDQNAFYLLHYAVDDGLLDVAKLLIEKGKISVNTIDQSGWSPLHLAAGHNSLDMVTLLLSKGADVNIRDLHGNTPLAWAKEMNAIDAITELEKHGAMADKEWHGEKLELKTNEEREQEARIENELENNDDDDNKQNEYTNNGQFEIEVENSHNQNNPIVLDALQRQRSANQNIY